MHYIMTVTFGIAFCLFAVSIMLLRWHPASLAEHDRELISGWFLVASASVFCSLFMPWADIGIMFTARLFWLIFKD